MNANKGDANRDISGKEWLIRETVNIRKKGKKWYVDLKQNLEVERQKTTKYLIDYNENLITEENWSSVLNILYTEVKMKQTGKLFSTLDRLVLLNNSQDANMLNCIEKKSREN